MTCDNYFFKLVASLEVEALDVKRILFDNGYQEAHNRVAEAETELRAAKRAILDQLGIAASAAPDVCEWTPSALSPGWFTSPHTGKFASMLRGVQAACPFCYRPINFKESGRP